MVADSCHVNWTVNYVSLRKAVLLKEPQHRCQDFPDKHLGRSPRCSRLTFLTLQASIIEILNIASLPPHHSRRVRVVHTLGRELF
jgi:hypothetical protein